MGIVMGLRQQFKKAEESFQLAIEQDPTLFLGWFHYARACFTVGKRDKAARLFEQTNRVEPDDYQSILLAAQAYDDIDCTDLTQTLRQRGVEIA
jgi:predicted Zn-dependent protease